MLNSILFLVAMLSVFGLIFWLRVLPFREKKSNEPQRTAEAELINRYIKSGADRSGRSRVGFNHVLTFRLNDGTEFDLYSYEEEYGALREGMTGKLTWQDRYFVNLETA